MSALYLREFKYRYPDTHHYEQELLPVLEILVASSRPIPTSDIETLLNYTKRQRAKVIERLGSYLTVTEQGVALFHKSLQDWLLDEKSAGADYFVEVEKGHRVLGKVLWEQFIQAEDLVSCLDSFMAMELPEQLKYWSDEEFLKVIDQDKVEKYSANIEKLIDLKTLPYLKHDQQESWGWLGVRLSELCYGLENQRNLKILNKFADFLNDIANYKKAEFLFRKALFITEKHQMDTCLLLLQLCVVLEDQGDYVSANEFRGREKLLRDNDRLPTDDDEVNNFYKELDRLAASEEHCRERLIEIENRVGSNHLEVIVGLDFLARCLLDKCDYEETELLYKRALAIAEYSLGPNHPSMRVRLKNLADILTIKSDVESAMLLYKRALDIYLQFPGTGTHNPSSRSGLIEFADILMGNGYYEQAEPLYRSALAIAEQTDQAVGFHMYKLAKLLHNKGEYDEAMLFYKKSLPIYVGNFGDESHAVTVIRKSIDEITNWFSK